MKYEFTGEEKTVANMTLKRIRSLVTIVGVVTSGDCGGWVEYDHNLDQDGDAWVYGDTEVFGNAMVYGNAKVYGNAMVYGDAKVYGNAMVYGDTEVFGNAMVYGNAMVFGNAKVFGNARVFGNAKVFGNARVFGNAWVYGDAKVYVNARVYGNAKVFGNAMVSIAPVVITGLDYTLTVSDNMLAVGCQCWTFQEWRDKTPEEIIGMDGKKATAFYPTLISLLDFLKK